MQKFTSREYIYMGLVIVLLIAFFVVNIAARADIASYQRAYVECMANVERFNSGYTDPYDRYIINVSNYTLNLED